MDYSFPNRRLQSPEILGPRALTDDIQQAGARLLEVTGHNLQASNIAANATLANNAMGRIEVDEKFENPSLGYGASTFTYPDSTAGQLLDDVGDWTEVEDISISVTTGTSTLAIKATIQYIWHSFVTAGVLATPPYDGWDHIAADTEYVEVNRSSSMRGLSVDATSIGNSAYSALNAILSADFNMAGVQFAISVDGLLVESSITGHLGVNRRDFIPIKARYERTETTPSPGPQTPRTPPVTGLGGIVYQAKIGCVVSVQPGTFEIKLHARRVPVPHRGTPSAKRTDVDFIRLLTRKMIVREKPTWAMPASFTDSIEIPQLSSDMIASTATLLTQRMGVVRSKINGLSDRTVRPWSLRSAHLPGTLIDANIDTQAPATFGSCTSKYPGYGSPQDQVVDTTGSANGWYQIRDGATMLEVAGSAGAWDATIPSVFVIDGNIEVIRIKNTTSPYRMSDMVAFAIGYLPVASSTWVIIQHSVGLNSKVNVYSTNESGTAISGFDNINCAVLGWLNLRLAPHAVGIQKFALFISVCSPQDQAPEVYWNRASIQVVQERA